MNDEVLRRELRRISIEANHRCFGCGFEHNCGIHGCAIVREALERLEEYRELGPIDHLRELTQAEKDGRLVVLPCGTGDELASNGLTFKADHWSVILTAFADDASAPLGKRVKLFYPEEAEAALKKREAENEPD